MEAQELIPEMEMMAQNRADLVDALQSVGEPVNDDTPMSELAEHIRHCGGDGDCYLATIVKSGSDKGKRKYFTKEEWGALSSSQQTGYAKIGILLVAEGHKLLIARTNATTETGANPQWSSANTSVPDLFAYGDSSVGVLNDFGSKENTDIILKYQSSGLTTVTFPAATLARAYKACTLADGGYDDDTVWSLPAMGHLLLMLGHRVKINDAFTHFFATGTIANANHWASNDYNANHYAWYASPAGAGNGNKSYSYVVRPVSAIDSL